MVNTSDISLLLIWLVPLVLAGCLLLIWRPWHRSGKVETQQVETANVEALDLLANAVAEERDHAGQAAKARLALEALPDSVDTLVALRAMRRFLPASSGPVLRNMLAEWWQDGHRPAVLAALAGVWQERQPSGRPGPGLDIVLRNAGPDLLGQVAGAFERQFGEMDDWFATAAILHLLEDAAARVRADHPALSDRLDGLGRRVGERTRQVALQSISRLVAETETDEDDSSPHGLAVMLRAHCIPRFPELLAEAQRAFSRHVEADWRIAAMELEVLVVESHGQRVGELDNFDFVAVRDRLREGLVGHDLAVSEAAASHAVRLIGQGYLAGAQDLLVFEDAMEWTANLHWPRPSSHAQLIALLAQQESPGEG